MEFTHFVRVWDNYRHVWEIDREDTIATFVKKKPKQKKWIKTKKTTGHLF